MPLPICRQRQIDEILPEASIRDFPDSVTRRTKIESTGIPIDSVMPDAVNYNEVLSAPLKELDIKTAFEGLDNGQLSKVSNRFFDKQAREGGGLGSWLMPAALGAGAMYLATGGRIGGGALKTVAEGAPEISKIVAGAGETAAAGAKGLAGGVEQTVKTVPKVTTGFQPAQAAAQAGKTPEQVGQALGTIKAPPPAKPLPTVQTDPRALKRMQGMATKQEFAAKAPGTAAEATKKRIQEQAARAQTQVPGGQKFRKARERLMANIEAQGPLITAPGYGPLGAQYYTRGFQRGLTASLKDNFGEYLMKTGSLTQAWEKFAQNNPEAIEKQAFIIPMMAGAAGLLGLSQLGGLAKRYFMGAPAIAAEEAIPGAWNKAKQWMASKLPQPGQTEAMKLLEKQLLEAQQAQRLSGRNALMLGGGALGTGAVLGGGFGGGGGPDIEVTKV